MMEHLSVALEQRKEQFVYGECISIPRTTDIKTVCI